MAPRLDKDLRKLSRLEEGVRSRGQSVVRLGLGLLFLAFVGLAASSVVGLDRTWAVVVVASVIAAYMALNIGANDVANNMSPAVGSRTLTIPTAVLIAAVCEAAGAIIAGGEVVATVSGGIIDPGQMPDSTSFVIAMIAALFAAALWINLATWLGAPVSTTHSVVGGVLGGGIAVAGFAAADWSVVARIVASWVVSPLLGGLIAAGLLAYIRATITHAPDRLVAARQQVPILVSLMTGAFTTYLLMKGLARIWPVSFWLALSFGFAGAVVCYVLVRPAVARALVVPPGQKVSVGDLFTIPVIGGAALLSFAHGSNDVANAIGPLAAIYSAVESNAVGSQAALPQWVLLIGAVGIAIGLLLYGPNLIRTVGSKITKLNRVRAFCITLSAAITVILASALGLPVSSTHIAIGALFGVGFLREYLANRNGNGSLSAPDAVPFSRRPDLISGSAEAGPDDKVRRRRLVRRSHLLTIAAAWVITVPATGLLAAILAWSISTSGVVTVH